MRHSRRRRDRHDVTFYTPWIGALLAGSESPPGGAETQILMLAKELAARGLRVAIIAYGDPDELPENVDGVHIVPRPMYSKRRLVGKIIELLVVWRSLWRAPAVNVVHRGIGLDVGLIALYNRLARQRLVFSSANVVDFDCRKLFRKRRDAALYELGVRSADVIVVQTEEQIELCRATYSRDPILIKSLAPLRDPAQRVPEAFLWVGRLVSYKQPLAYLELARAVPEASFWMVGVPPPTADEEPVAEAVLAGARELANFRLLSPRPRTEVERLMARAVASVNTAVFEGMPNVLLEAWTRGVPALVLHHDPGGVVKRYGLGGFADGSFDRLVELARGQWEERTEVAQRASVAERCRRYVLEHHAPETVVGQWITVLTGRRERVTASNRQPAVEPTCVG